MRSGRSKALALWLGALVVAGCGAENALVGGRCEPGYEPSGDACVAIAAPTATPPSAPVDAPSPPPPAPAADGSVSAPAVDAGPVALADRDAAISAYEQRQPLVCGDGLVACRGACIPVDADGQNCGACGKICPSNICVAGACQGATPGDVVVIGHDFTKAWSGSAQAKVLIDAVSIPTTDPIRILSYEADAAPDAVANVKALLVEGIRGRGVRIDVTTDATALASDALARSYDVVLVHDGAGPAPADRGAAWATSLPSFAQAGGVVVALDGARSDMPALLTSAALLPIGGHTLLPEGARVVVSAPSDVVGTQVLSPYAPAGPSVTFQGVAIDASVTAVVRADAADGGDPIVLHRVVD